MSVDHYPTLNKYFSEKLPNHPLQNYLDNAPDDFLRGFDLKLQLCEKINNFESLLINLKNCRDNISFESFMSEVKVAAILISNKKTLEYEPQDCEKPPEYKIDSNEYLEVKLVGNLKVFLEWDKIQKEVERSVTKLRKPCYVGLSFRDRYFKSNSELFKNIVSRINEKIEEGIVEGEFNILFFEDKLILHKEGSYFNWPSPSIDVGYLTFKKHEELKKSICSVLSSWTGSDEIKNVRNQIKKARKKTIPLSSKFYLCLATTPTLSRDIKEWLDDSKKDIDKFDKVYITDIKMDNNTLEEYLKT